MTPEDMAAIQGKASKHGGRWSAADFIDILSSPGGFSISAKGCFALGRIVLDEVELLQIATDPAYQRQGLATAVLIDFEKHALNAGASQAFLEVAITNLPACALYQKLGWREAGLRRGYYKSESYDPIDALIFNKDFTSTKCS